MKLITILNRCYRFRGFVYQHAHMNKALDKVRADETGRMRREGAIRS